MSETLDIRRWIDVPGETSANDLEVAPGEKPGEVRIGRYSLRRLKAEDVLAALAELDRFDNSKQSKGERVQVRLEEAFDSTEERVFRSGHVTFEPASRSRVKLTAYSSYGCSTSDTVDRASLRAAVLNAEKLR